VIATGAEHRKLGVDGKTTTMVAVYLIVLSCEWSIFSETKHFNWFIVVAIQL